MRQKDFKSQNARKSAVKLSLEMAVLTILKQWPYHNNGHAPVNKENFHGAPLLDKEL